MSVPKSIDSKALAELLAQKLLSGEMTKIDLDTLDVGSLVKESAASVESEAEEKPKPVFEDAASCVEIGDCFQVQAGVYKTLVRNIKSGVNTMLLGPTGVGKTELVANIARELDLPLTIFDMGTMTDPIMSLVGTHIVEVKEGVTGSSFKRSRFSEVIQKPGIVLLDEISRASAAANNLLFPVLDFRKELAMEYDFTDNTPVKIHPECVFVSTANLGSQYTGAHKLDRALVDRFMAIEIDPLAQASIIKVINHLYPALGKKKVKWIVDCYAAINGAHDEYKISFNLSMRHLKIISQMVVDGFTIYDSFYIVCKGVGGKDGLKAIETILTDVK